MIKIIKPIAAALLIITLCACTYMAYAQDIVLSNTNVSGEYVVSDSIRYYTGDVNVFFDASADDEITKAELVFSGKQAAVKSYEGSSKITDSLKIEKSFLAGNEPADYHYEGILKVTDRSGNTQEEHLNFYADASVPEIEIKGIEDGKCRSDEIAVKISMTDKNIVSDNAAIGITKDGDKILEETDIEKCKNFSANLNDEGSYVLEASIKDKGQHFVSQKIKFIIDKTDPAIKDLNASGERKSGYEWFGSDVTLSAGCSDDKSGIKAVKLSINGEDVRTFKEGEALEFTATKQWFEQNKTSDGKYTYTFTAEDNAGNKASQSGTFYASVSAPEIKINGIEQGACTNKAPIVIAESVNEAICDSIELRVIKGSSEYKNIVRNENRASFRATEDGKYVIKAVSIDKAGNRSDEESISFIFDTQKPISDGLKIYGKKRSGYKWYKENVKVRADVNDPLSEIAHCEMSINSKKVYEKDFTEPGEKKISASISREWFIKNSSSDGKYEVILTAIDKAGNSRNFRKIFYADVITPNIDLSGIKNGEFTNSTPCIQAVSYDDFANRNRIDIKILRNGKEYASKTVNGKTGTFRAFNDDGKYFVKVYITDRAGNRAYKSIRFVKDTSAPVISVSGAKNGSYTTGSKTIIAKINELNYQNMKVSGSITRKLDSDETNISWGTLQPDNKNFTCKRKVGKTGTYTVKLNAEDAAGNKAKSVTLIFTIDNEKPDIKITNVKDIYGSGSVVMPIVTYSDSYLSSKNISIKREDGRKLQEISERSHNVKNGAAKTYTIAEKRECDGIYTISCSCTDKAGNKATATKTFTVCRFGSRFDDEKAAGLNKRSVNEISSDIVIEEKNPAGIKNRTCMISKDGRTTFADVRILEVKNSPWPTYRYSFSKEQFSDEGIYDLNISSTDNAGNMSEYSTKNKSIRFSVDKTPPQISISGVDEKTAYKENKKTAKLHISDAISLSSYSVSCDGKTVKEETGLTGFYKDAVFEIPAGINMDVSVKAVDKAGNVNEKTLSDITVSANFILRLWSNKPAFFGSIAGILAAAVFVIMLLRRRQKGQQSV